MKLDEKMKISQDKRITDFKDDEIKLLIDAAVRGEIELYIILPQNGQKYTLNPGDVESIYSMSKRGRLARIKIPNRDAEDVSLDNIWVQEQDLRTVLIDTHQMEALYPDSTLQHILLETIKKFWTNYEPHNPPKSEVIIQWLMKEKKLSKRQAKAIDMIARPDELRKGGNRPRATTRPTSPSKDRTLSS